MGKKVLGTVIALVFMMQCISISIAKADDIFFPGCAQVESTKLSKGEWGALGIDEIKFNNQDQDSVSSAESVFNKFKLYRAEDYYRPAIKKPEDIENYKVNFLYNWWDSKYPNICFGDQQAKFIGIYNPNNNKRNFDVDFAAYLDADLKKLVEKEDLQIMIMADTRNFDNGKDYETGIASIRFYGSGSPILKQVSTSEYEYRKGKTNNDTETAINKGSGWHTFPKGCTRILAYLQSSGGDKNGKQNRAAVTNVRVYLKDGGKPNVHSVGLIYDQEWRDYKPIGNNGGKGKVIGDTVRYWVKFDEKVKVTGTPKLWLDVGQGNHLEAEYVKTNDKQDHLYFDYKIKDMTNEGYNINTLGKAIKIECPTGAKITDIAGNPYDTRTDITSKFTNKTHTIDDTYTLIHQTNYTDTSNGAFYPKRTDYYGSDINQGGYPYAIGKRPVELTPPELTGGSGDQSNQPTMFGIKNDKYPIFRIVLNEEIKVNTLSRETTKLKLQVYNKNKQLIDNRFVTADLAGARIMHVNNNANNGINTGQTELLFRYEPKINDFANLEGELFYLDFKGQFNEKNEFVFADDIITPLKNVSGMEVINNRLVLPPVGGSQRTPLNKIVGIDLEGPALDWEKTKIDTGFKKQLDGSSYLKFKDEGSGVSQKGAYIWLCYYDNNIKRKAKIKYGPDSGDFVVLSCRDGHVSLDGISIEPDKTIKYPLYLEYDIADKAGNTATNKNEKNIEIKIDTIPPVVNGVKVTVEGNKATAKYDVSDQGVDKIDPEFYYKVQKVETLASKGVSGIQIVEKGISGIQSVETLASGAQSVEKDVSGIKKVELGIGRADGVPPGKPLSTNSPEQKVEIAGVQGSKDTYKLWANFSDTVGNQMDSYFPTDTFDIATRVFNLSLDSAEGRVAKEHNIKIRGDKIPDKDFIIKLYYKWVPSGKNASDADEFEMIEYQPVDFINNYLTSFNLASEEIQKKWMKAYTGREDLFNGEVQFIGYAEMWTKTTQGTVCEAKQEYIGNTFYFDIAPPVINAHITGENDGYNSDYRVQYEISDGGGEYHNGIYEANGHFDFDNNPPLINFHYLSISLEITVFHFVYKKQSSC